MLRAYAQTINYETFNPKADHCLDFVYLHGELEKANGFDLLAVTYQQAKEYKGIDIYKGDVDIIFFDGTHEVCTLYFWRTVDRQHGLVCRKTDKEANAYALIKFESKADHL